MKVIIEGDKKELADLVSLLQNRHEKSRYDIDEDNLYMYVREPYEKRPHLVKVKDYFDAK